MRTQADKVDRNRPSEHVPLMPNLLERLGFRNNYFT